MGINNDTLKGYILEEVLAYLIRHTGYKLLVDSRQDPQDLDNRGNGLVVKGRGGVHQVDVLGQLEWIPAFTFPLRLFVEAKFRKGKTGIDAVRNAIGVILDINQNNSPTRGQTIFPQKYQYVYALFSTSGFSGPATEMALAHQISLIDLSGNEFNDLRDAISQASDRIVGRIDRGEYYEPDELDISGRGELVLSVRNILRNTLGTMPSDIETPRYENSQLRNALEPVTNVARQYKELFVAMANGPYMLLMKANNPQFFLDYARKRPRHRVTIRWSRQIDDGRTWIIASLEDSNAYTLSFRLPELLSRWIFDVKNGARERALQTKQTFFSNIAIYRYIDGQDFLFRLEFDLESTRRQVEEENIR